MPGPQRFAPPAADALTFRPGFWRTFSVVLAMTVPIWLVLLLLMNTLATAPRPLQDWLLLVQLLTGPFVYAGAFALTRWSRCRDWLRVSSAGLELASGGSSPILVRWPALESVRLVRRFGTPMLEVTPTGPEGVHVHTGGSFMPPRQSRNGRDTFVVDIWLLRPGRAALRSALERHLPPGTMLVP
ncbi:hypothetical protein [Dactylosporangium sp. NPDC048998]|uniref:hypothetical protein n=1 Tax=Dactylosporangium sp. NPDC048998 TaxID=3363976 RepID=UPI00371FB2CD